MKSMKENEANRISFTLTLLSLGKVKVWESGRKWLKSMVPLSMAGYQQFSWNSLGVMSNVKVFAKQDSQPDNTWLIIEIYTHVDQKRKGQANLPSL